MVTLFYIIMAIVVIGFILVLMAAASDEKSEKEKKKAVDEMRKNFNTPTSIDWTPFGKDGIARFSHYFLKLDVKKKLLYVTIINAAFLPVKTQELKIPFKNIKSCEVCGDEHSVQKNGDGLLTSVATLAGGAQFGADIKYLGQRSPEDVIDLLAIQLIIKDPENPSVMLPFAKGVLKKSREYTSALELMRIVRAKIGAITD